MGRCIQCSNIQAKLNKGQLCKTCFSIKINPEQNINITNDDSDDKYNDNGMVNDHTIIDLIKENMMKKQIWNEEVITVLNNEHSLHNQKQNTPSKYSPTNTDSMIFNDNYSSRNVGEVFTTVHIIHQLTKTP